MANKRTLSMPLGMVVGALLYKQVIELDTITSGFLTPALISLMLFITFCRVNVKSMKIEQMHIIILTFQIAVSLAVYFAILPLDKALAQGGMVCVLTPIAMAAVVIGGMLGANIVSMTTYSLLSNVSISLLAPLIFTIVGNGDCTFAQMLGKVAPMLIAPFVVAQLLRITVPKLTTLVGNHGSISFYLWIFALVLAIGRTTGFIFSHDEIALSDVVALSLVALVVCLVQFGVGRWLGHKYNETVTGGQSLGQKNTILAIWMAQSFLSPISSIAPAAYIVWQNLINSYQMYLKEKRDRAALSFEDKVHCKN